MRLAWTLHPWFGASDHVLFKLQSKLACQLRCPMRFCTPVGHGFVQHGAFRSSELIWAVAVEMTKRHPTQCLFDRCCQPKSCWLAGRPSSKVVVPICRDRRRGRRYWVCGCPAMSPRVWRTKCPASSKQFLGFGA